MEGAVMTDAQAGLLSMPTARGCLTDPASELQALREERPVARLSFPDGTAGWLVTSHGLARAVLSDARFEQWSGLPPAGDPAVIAAAAEFRQDPIWSGSLIDHDPPEHTRLRRMQAGFFTPGRLSGYQDAVRRICADRLDAMESAGHPVDFVATFSSPFASIVLCALLDVPEDDRDRFERLTDSSVFEFTTADFDDLRSYMYDVVARKRAQPGTDVLSQLIGQGELSDDELAGATLKLFTAGHDTSSMQLSASMFALLARRQHWEMLTEDPSRIRAAVEELLRYCTIVQWTPETRRATEDVELGGVLIRAGEPVTISLPAANRDGAKFEKPDQLDLTRNAIGHLAFGHGRHMCLGQHLVRLEMQVALEGLVARFPSLRLAVPPDQVEMRAAGLVISGPRRLPVAW
jgi:cytochrome P450